MRKGWPVMIFILTAMLFPLLLNDNPNAAEAILEDDEYFISVDPTDPDMGVLEVHGEFDPELTIGQRLSVTLGAVVREVKDGKATGRIWHSEIEWDDSALGTTPRVFDANDGAEEFTVYLDPERFNPDLDEGITVPPGLSLDVEGRLTVTATFTGIGVSDGSVETKAKIFPEPYHLINLTTPSGPVSLEATDRLIYSISIKNAGNMDEIVYLEIPVLQDLRDLDFEAELEKDSFENLIPGKTVNSTLTIKAPLEITKNRSMVMEIKAYTLAEDPSTLEPASYKEINIDLELVRSRVKRPNTDTDTDDEKPDDEEPKPNINPSKEPVGLTEDTPGWLVVIILGFVILFIIVVIFFIRKGGDGGDEDEEMEDAHASMVRI